MLVTSERRMVEKIVPYGKQYHLESERVNRLTVEFKQII